MDTMAEAAAELSQVGAHWLSVLFMCVSCQAW